MLITFTNKMPLKSVSTVALPPICNIISNEFNDNFVNVGPKLATNIPQINDDSATNYITGSYPNSISVLKNTSKEIINIVHLLKSGSSVGIDEISSVVVKISIPLNTIINLCLNSGQFRNQ